MHVDRLCAFTKKIVIADRRLLGAARTLRLVARFRGNKVLTSRTSRGQTLKIHR